MALALLLLILELDYEESTHFPKWYIMARLIAMKNHARNLIVCLSGLLQFKPTFLDNQITSIFFWILSGDSKLMIK